MKSELLAQLAAHGQEHLLAHWDTLTDAERATIAEQIRSVDLDLIDRLFKHQAGEIDWAALAARAESPPAIRLRDPNNRFSAAEARRRGEAELRADTVGVIIVAGGQGTRLGFPKPKGMFPIGPVSGATLLQMLFEKIIGV